MATRLRVCFVTGTRSEFGLMRPVLDAITRHRQLSLQIIATGMHLDRRLGYTVRQIAESGFKVNAVVPWKRSSSIALAAATGSAIAGLSGAFSRLKPTIVLVVGDRVEAFAGASAAHLSQFLVAHVHGGDRALGQVDDSLRHAITKLAHVHFPATAASARRIIRLGEDPAWVRCVGSPGNDGITEQAWGWDELRRRYPSLAGRRFALVLLHPAGRDSAIERDRAELVLAATRSAGIEKTLVIYPNNDPGAEGILAAWKMLRRFPDVLAEKSAPRGAFLGLLRDAAVLVGNSSSGIIEAASFGTPVVDIGPRQLGREHSRNLVHCEYDSQTIARALRRIWRGGHPMRCSCRNVYGCGGAGARMADILASLSRHTPPFSKLISY